MIPVDNASQIETHFFDKNFEIGGTFHGRQKAKPVDWRVP